jgi:hypothetical protein
MELVEPDNTEPIEFIPPDIRERFLKRKPA